MKRNILAALITLAICGALRGIFLMSIDLSLDFIIYGLLAMGVSGTFFAVREALK